MTKQLTSKELGIPSGYRLSESNISNIVMVATRQLFADEMIKHVRKESEIFNLIMGELYPDKLLDELETISRKLTREKASKPAKVVDRSSSIKLVIDKYEHKIGCRNYYYSYASIKEGVADSQEFRDVLANLPDHKLKDIGIDGTSNEANHRQLSDLWFKHKSPFADQLKVSEQNVLSVLTPNLRKKIKRFIETREKLATKIGEKRLLLRSIANAYTSAVKLCNDAPEFVEYITNSAIYNKDGKKCTDMSTMDMIAQLRKK